MSLGTGVIVGNSVGVIDGVGVTVEVVVRNRMYSDTRFYFDLGTAWLARDSCQIKLPHPSQSGYDIKSVRELALVAAVNHVLNQQSRTLLGEGD